MKNNIKYWLIQIFDKKRIAVDRDPQPVISTHDKK